MWPLSLHSSCPLWVSQPYTQPSSDAVSSLWPSGEKAEELTWKESTEVAPAWGKKHLSVYPDLRLQEQPQTLPQEPQVGAWTSGFPLQPQPRMPEPLLQSEARTWSPL